MTTSSTPPLPSAGLIRRLIAIVYDSLLLLGIAFAYGVVLTVLRIMFMGEDAQGYIDLPLIVHIASWFVLWGICAGYYVYCWTRRGQTLGMKSWHLQIEIQDGHYPGAREAWLRSLLALVSAAVFGLGYIWCLFDKKGGCWHDRWTHTRVVVTPKTA